MKRGRREPSATGFRSAHLGFSATGLESHPLGGVDVHAVDVENPMEMWAGRTAGRTRVAEDVAAVHLGTWRGDKLGHVQVHGLKALAVVNADSVAENIELLGKGDRPGRDRADRFAGGRALVNAAVVLASGLAVV